MEEGRTQSEKTSAYVVVGSHYLPNDTLTNEQITLDHPEWSVDKIASKTGIKSRHIASSESTSSMAIKAGLLLLKKYALSPDDIDFLLLCTQSPDYFLPSTSCIVHEGLGLGSSCGALDFNLGCSGFVYGLGLAKGLVSSGQAKNVLLITAETYSKFINKNDKSNKTIFGDAAAATLISTYLGGHDGGLISNFEHGTDGSGADKLIVKGGGLKTVSSYEGTDSLSRSLSSQDRFLYMDGQGIFAFTISAVPTLVKTCLLKNNLKIADIDLFVFHQANKFMLNHLRKKLHIDESKFFIFIEECGNTVSSTIPIALEAAVNQGRIACGDKIMLVGFGVGLSWSATVLRF